MFSPIFPLLFSSDAARARAPEPMLQNFLTIEQLISLLWIDSLLFVSILRYMRPEKLERG
jgi:hypothetical protein